MNIIKNLNVNWSTVVELFLLLCWKFHSKKNELVILEPSWARRRSQTKKWWHGKERKAILIYKLYECIYVHTKYTPSYTLNIFIRWMRLLLFWYARSVCVSEWVSDYVLWLCVFMLLSIDSERESIKTRSLYYYHHFVFSLSILFIRVRSCGRFVWTFICASFAWL